MTLPGDGNFMLKSLCAFYYEQGVRLRKFEENGKVTWKIVRYDYSKTDKSLAGGRKR